MNAKDVKDKRVTVIGGKRSGVAAAQLLKRQGAKVFLTERDAIDRTFLEKLERSKIDYESGGHTERVFDCDFAVISPGVPSNAPVVKRLAAANVPIYSEIEMSSWFCKAKIVAITGTDGKTTTTALAHKIFERDGKEKGYRAFGVGNIGVPFADYVEEMSERDVAVVETSSFQLEHCFSYKPKVAVITNITPDHLDRYDNDFRKYASAKYRIYQAQDEADFLVVNLDNEELRRQFTDEAILKALKPKLIPTSLREDLSKKHEACAYLDGEWLTIKLNGETERIMKKDEVVGRVHFRGTHNVYNTLAAAVAARAMEVKKEIIRESVMAFEGVEHRIEFVRELNGVQFINDSKATTVNALWYALDTIPAPIILIAGGRDKGNDYAKVEPLVKEKVKLVVAIGESREKVAEAFGKLTKVVKADTLDDAVRAASREAIKGDTVLLSPACASFDMFANFEERGETFKRLVGNL
ncbi:MAG: UDP-N-acetylmuramoyl-L-alanine--D-glutamate ligase [Chloroherpetonaceae bacterium]|nr:UDP-N-acetylmuramoyl-L-alanine--D-glutamate ligase [Chloroherpetonaceae bacterium]MDW8437641.1 UDP-N-acetylmuramoyl-L-alanine--D-glutamate ligase [Chloroherpetonaceae bacterium]